MHLVLAVISLVSSVPALWLGFKAVVAFDLPFEAGFIPVFFCIALSGFFVARAERDMAR